MCFPFILCYRCIVWFFAPCFKQRDKTIVDYEARFKELQKYNGGWFRDNRCSNVTVRDTFYIFIIQKMQNKLDQKKLGRFVNKLAHHMSNNGHVPWSFQENWVGDETPVYKNNHVPVIDANMQFIIMAHWVYEKDDHGSNSLYLYVQRAWQWLDISIANDTLHEKIGASWETSRKHNGILLLSNVLMIRTLRVMELIHMYEKNERQKKLFVKMHERAVSTWTPEIYKTQETLPRILAVHFNIVPRTFIKSFNQEIQSVWIPCRVEGPIKHTPTTTAWLRGYADQHDTIIWPWIGFMWIIILYDKNMHDIAASWWTSYMEFHKPNNLYDIYDQETGKPVRRAFLKGHASHTLTIAAWLVAKERVTNALI
jgi:hypothetical protein